jgi:choline-sulfatase
MNVVFILSDQHNVEFSGCYGGPTRTPNLDELAAGGARFEAAYCNSPLCTPSRASMFSGRYVHETGYWDNATPYDGKIPGWGHYFHGKNVAFNIVGKVDLQEGIDHGIGNQRCVKLRHNFDPFTFYRNDKVPRYSHLANPWVVSPRPEGTLWERDDKITKEAIRWLKEDRPNDRPWVLDVHYFHPHPRYEPVRSRFEYYLKTLPEDIAEKYRQPCDDLHPVDQAQSFHSCGYMKPDTEIRPMHAGYHAQIEETDLEIGRVLNALEELGLREDTLVIYSSDHGEMARAHGTLGKIALYDDAARVPLIVNGPGIPAEVICETPVSLIDIYPTVSEAVGIPSACFARGRSVLGLARDEADPERPDFVFSESHGNGRITGTFMIRHGDWKLLEYVGYDPVLFNLKDDPEELNNLVATESGMESVQQQLYALRRRLSSVCSPEAVNARAFNEQQARKMQLAQTGRLQAELVKRGMQPDVERLVPDAALIKEHYGIDI